MSAWLTYSLARLGIFIAVFALLYVVGITWWVSAIFAAVVSFTAAYIFLAGTRQQMAQIVQQRLESRRKKPSIDLDALAEDGINPDNSSARRSPQSSKSDSETEN